MPARPIVILIAGHAGVGKSSLAALMASACEFTVVDKDTVGLPFVEALCAAPYGDPDDRTSVRTAIAGCRLMRKTASQPLTRKSASRARRPVAAG